MSEVFDAEKLDPFNGPGKDVQAAQVGTVQVATPALIKAKSDFRALYAELPWIDAGETAALLAIQIAILAVFVR